MSKAHPLERDVKKKIQVLLDKHNFFWWSVPMNGYGKSGISDLQALRAGVFLAIEVKLNATKEPTYLQRAFLESIQAEQGFAFCVNGDNLDHFQAWLEAFDRSTGAVSKGGKPTQEDGSIMLNAIAALQAPWIGGKNAGGIKETTN